MDCPDCDRLQLALNRIVRRSLDILGEYQSAVRRHDMERIEIARIELHDIEALRREARLKLTAHQESHNAGAMATGR